MIESHGLRLAMVTTDCVDPLGSAQWWAELLGGTIIEASDEDFYRVEIPGLPLRLGFQRVDVRPPGKNILHLDIDSAPSVSESRIRRWLESRGATHVSEHDEDGLYWNVYADPDGNQFCIGDPDFE